MGFRIEATGEYFQTDHALRDFLRGSIDVPLPITLEFMEQHGIGPVFEGPQASGGTVYQYSQYAGIEQDDQGRWFTKYVLGPIFTDRPATDTEPAQTAAEQEAAYKAMKDAEKVKSVRTSRNDKLKECDWTQIIDSTADKVVWAIYRQELRDITAQADFPWNVDWPTQPEE